MFFYLSLWFAVSCITKFMGKIFSSKIGGYVMGIKCNAIKNNIHFQMLF